MPRSVILKLNSGPVRPSRTMVASAVPGVSLFLRLRLEHVRDAVDPGVAGVRRGRPGGRGAWRLVVRLAGRRAGLIARRKGRGNGARDRRARQVVESAAFGHLEE